MDMIYKTFRAECKEVDADGSLNMFIPVSTDSVDRDGEIVEPSAFKKTLPKFMKRPVLVSSHDYRDLTSQIGEWTKLKITENGIEGKPKYYVGQGNEQADWGFKLASKGMAAFSIGFIPKEWVDGDGVKEPRRTYKEVELLEISQVIVPSNREAIQSIRSKSANPLINQLIEDIINAPIVDLTLETDRVTKPEETNEYIRIPVDSGNHDGHRIRTIDISEKEGIKALYCGTDKVIMTYLFDKSKGWDMAKAEKWVKDHEKKALEVEHEISQNEIIDEIDYLITLIDKAGLSEEGKKSFEELLRASGCDKSVEIKQKEGSLTNQDILESLKRISKGGEGSGNFGHEGRPGDVGGSGGGGGGGNADSEGNYHSSPSLTGQKVSSPNEPHIGDEHNLDRNTIQFQSTQKEMLIGNKNYIVRTELQRKGDDDKFHFNIVNQYGKRGTEAFNKTVTDWEKAHPGYDFTPQNVERQLARKFDK